GNAGNQESATIVTVSGSNIGFASPLKFAHGTGEPIVRTGGNLQYVDLELPQDVCAEGRVARFGKNSEPSLTAAGELFASGLSPSGRLTAGKSSQAFYGYPLVAWTPALGASAYEVQWSKTRYPFARAPNPHIETGRRPTSHRANPAASLRSRRSTTATMSRCGASSGSASSWNA